MIRITESSWASRSALLADGVCGKCGATRLAPCTFSGSANPVQSHADRRAWCIRIAKPYQVTVYPMRWRVSDAARRIRRMRETGADRD